MPNTPQQIINALRAFNDLPIGQAPTAQQIIDLIKSVEWTVPTDKTVLLYSGEFASVGGEKIFTYEAVDAITKGQPGKFFIDGDTGIGQILNAKYLDAAGNPLKTPVGEAAPTIVETALLRSGQLDRTGIASEVQALWTLASEQLATRASGAVLTISPYADLYDTNALGESRLKVFAGHELPALLVPDSEVPQP